MFHLKSIISVSLSSRLFTLFSWIPCLAHSYHSISQSSTQLLDWHFLSICILIVFSRSMEVFALFIFQVFSMRPLRDFLDLDNTKAAKSVCPSAFILSGMMQLHLNWGRGGACYGEQDRYLCISNCMQNNNFRDCLKN